MLGKYKLIHLLGSTRDHKEIFRYVEEELTKQGYIVFAPVFYDINIYNQMPNLLDDMCYEKLLVCDAVCVVTPDHIGKSTIKRLQQVKELGKERYIWINNQMEKY